MALSTCEAEYISITIAASQGIWLSHFIAKLTGEKVKQVTMKFDNKPTIDLKKKSILS